MNNHERPNLSKQELYHLTVLTSAGFNEYRTQKLIDRAKEQTEGFIGGVRAIYGKPEK